MPSSLIGAYSNHLSASTHRKDSPPCAMQMSRRDVVAITDFTMGMITPFDHPMAINNSKINSGLNIPLDLKKRNRPFVPSQKKACTWCCRESAPYQGNSIRWSLFAAMDHPMSSNRPSWISFAIKFMAIGVHDFAV